MSALKVDRDQDGRVVAIFRHVTIRQILLGLAAGVILLLIAAGCYQLSTRMFSSSPGNIKLQLVTLIMAGSGIFLVALTLRRVFSPSSRDIRIADGAGVRFMYYGALGTVPWSEISGFARVPAIRKGMGKELLVVQLVDGEKQLARLRAGSSSQSYLPGGKMEIPFATLAASSLLDVVVLEQTLRQLVAQRKMVLTPASNPRAVPAVAAKKAPSRLLQALSFIIPIIVFAAAMIYRRHYGLEALRNAQDYFLVAIIAVMASAWLLFTVLRRKPGKAR